MRLWNLKLFLYVFVCCHGAHKTSIFARLYDIRTCPHSMTPMRSPFGSWSVVKCIVGPGQLMCNPEEIQNGFGRDFLYRVLPCWGMADIGEYCCQNLALQIPVDQTWGPIKISHDKPWAKDLLGNPWGSMGVLWVSLENVSGLWTKTWANPARQLRPERDTKFAMGFGAFRTAILCSDHKFTTSQYRDQAGLSEGPICDGWSVFGSNLTESVDLRWFRQLERFQTICLSWSASSQKAEPEFWELVTLKSSVLADVCRHHWTGASNEESWCLCWHAWNILEHFFRADLEPMASSLGSCKKTFLIQSTIPDWWFRVLEMGMDVTRRQQYPILGGEHAFASYFRLFQKAYRNFTRVPYPILRWSYPFRFNLIAKRCRENHGKFSIMRPSDHRQENQKAQALLEQVP